MSEQYAKFRLDVGGQVERQNDVIRKLERENAELRKSVGNKAPGGDGQNQTELRVLEERMSTYRKERKAIQTIMENKIKALADNIAVATKAVISDSMRDPSMSRDTEPSKQLNREVQALQRLVNAAITALKNAAE